jgi:hypothetical protein
LQAPFKKEKMSNTIRADNYVVLTEEDGVDWDRDGKILIGPGDFESWMGEPEDASWVRDGAGAVQRLNKLHDLLRRCLSQDLDKELYGEICEVVKPHLYEVEQ